jgi:hypothetical protein
MNNDKEKYVSSIIFKYGDSDNVSKDVTTLKEILARQGSSLLIDVIANHVGETVIKFNLNNEDSKRLVDSLVNKLKESLLERT